MRPKIRTFCKIVQSGLRKSQVISPDFDLLDVQSLFICLLTAIELLTLLLQTVFSIAPFPYRKVAELREKFTYDIHPFSTFNKGNSEERISAQQGTYFLSNSLLRIASLKGILPGKSALSKNTHTNCLQVFY